MFVGSVWFEVSPRQLRRGLGTVEGLVNKYRDRNILGTCRACLAVSIKDEHVQMMIKRFCPRSQSELLSALPAVSKPCDLKPLDTKQSTNTVPVYANPGPGYANLRPS